MGVGGGWDRWLGLLRAYFLGLTRAPDQCRGAGQTQAATRRKGRRRASDEAGQFVSKVLGSTEDVWTRIFQQSGGKYRAPTLVLYEGAVRSACGTGQAAMGPFYCPNDEKLYLDLSFFRALQQRFRAPGDFAQAYVVAHEVGHHVQKLTGKFQELEAQGRPPERPNRARCAWSPGDATRSGDITRRMKQLVRAISPSAQCRDGDRRRPAAEENSGARRSRCSRTLVGAARAWSSVEWIGQSKTATVGRYI